MACLFSACLGLLSGVRRFHGCFRVLPLLCYTLSPVSALLCCPLHQLSLCFALLSRAALRVHLDLPLLPRSPLLALVAPLISLVLLLSFIRCLGLLRLLPSSSLCLVTVLLSLCSWFVGPVTPSAAAPVPEAFVPHLCLPPLALMFDLYIYRYLVALLPLAAGPSQAPLPPCSLFVEFLLLLLLLVVLSFCLRLSVYAPHSVAPARRVSLLASGLPGSSLLPPRLPPCSVGRGFSWVLRLRLLLHGWLDWGPLSRSRFLSVVWSPLCLLPVCLAGCSWFSAYWNVIFLLASVWRSRFTVLLFILLGPDLSLSALLAPALLPLRLFLVGSGVCLCCHRSSCFPSPSFLWHTCWYPSVSVRLSSSSLFPAFLVGSSSSAFPWRPSSPFFWFCPGRWLVFLALSSACRLVIDRRLLSSLWFGWCFGYLPCGPTPGLLAVPPFLLSGSRRCVLSLTLGFSVPLPVSSSWAPLSRFSSFAASSSPGYSLWLLDPAFVLLLCASSYSLLAACLLFLFFGTCFPGPQYVPGFSLVFLALVSVGLRPVSVWSCFWASCPFGCWGSRFSLPLAVFRV